MISFHKWTQIMKFPSIYEAEYSLATETVYRRYGSISMADIPLKSFDDQVTELMAQNAHNRIALRKWIVNKT